MKTIWEKYQMFLIAKGTILIPIVALWIDNPIPNIALSLITVIVLEILLIHTAAEFVMTFAPFEVDDEILCKVSPYFNRLYTKQNH